MSSIVARSAGETAAEPGAQTGAVSPQGEEIRVLNTLRGLAALIVVVSHYANASGFHPAFGAGAGQIGVMIFFLLSGFLMSHLYLARRADAAALRAFARARIGRVVPLFVVVVLASYLGNTWAPASIRPALYPIADAPMLWSHLFFLHGESVLWTIPPEMQFYALFALGWVAFARAPQATTIVCGILLGLDVWFGLEPKHGAWLSLTITEDLGKAMPYFAVGVVLGRCYGRVRIPESVRSPAWMILLLGVPALYPRIFRWLTGFDHLLWNDPLVLGALTFIFFAVVFLTPRGTFLLENAIGDHLGRISYSIYLLHLPLLHWVLVIGWTGAAGFVLLLALVTATATLSYRYIESPLRRRVGGRSAPAAVQGVALPS